MKVNVNSLDSSTSGKRKRKKLLSKLTLWHGLKNGQTHSRLFWEVLPYTYMRLISRLKPKLLTYQQCCQISATAAPWPIREGWRHHSAIYRLVCRNFGFPPLTTPPNSNTNNFNHCVKVPLESKDTN
jgi:hypothetical protein